MHVDYGDSDSISRGLEAASELVKRLSAYATAGVGLTPKQYLLLSEMVPALYSLRTVHAKDCIIHNRKTWAELETMWSVSKDWATQFRAVHVPCKTMRYYGLSLPVYAGMNYMAFNSNGAIWMFSHKPEIVDGTWQSCGNSYELTRIQTVPLEDWKWSLRVTAELEEVIRDPEY